MLVTKLTYKVKVRNHLHSLPYFVCGWHFILFSAHATQYEEYYYKHKKLTTFFTLVELTNFYWFLFPKPV